MLRSIKLLVPLRHLQRRARRIHPCHFVADPRQMKREASLIGEAVERLAMRVAGRRGIVLALIEEGAGLLSAQPVEVKAHAVQGEDGAGALASHQLRIARRATAPVRGCGDRPARSRSRPEKCSARCLKHNLPQVRRDRKPGSAPACESTSLYLSRMSPGSRSASLKITR